MTTGHYDAAVLIRRAIAKYDGRTGGAKDYRDLGAVLPEHCRVLSEGGSTYVELLARSVSADLAPVAMFEVIDHEPDLRRVDRAGMDRQEVP